jgi:hypothetical protein
MVFSYALCAVNLASAALANGICCIYQMHKDEARKKEQEAIIRETIHSEWERHRHADMSDEQRKERNQQAWKPQVERRIRFVETKDEGPPSFQHHPYASSTSAVCGRQRPPNKAGDQQCYPNIRCDLYAGGNLDKSYMSTVALKSDGKDVGKVDVFRGGISQVASLMDDSDEEDEQLEDVCIE